MNNNGIRGLSKSLLDAVRGVMEAQEGGHPKTAKQKELAAKAPPHDKITHADVLAARGVLKKHPVHGKMVVAKEEADLDEASLSAKDAAAGKDIGKPGKAFSQIAKSAGAKYGSKEAGLKVAGAVLAKMRAKNESVEVDEGVELEEGLMHDRYVRSHGKKAKGTGSWAFTTKQFGSPKEHEMHFTSGQKSLSDAHKEAAAKLGTKNLYVMEEVEDLEELSVDAMKKYRTAARDDAMDADAVDDERRFRKRAAGSNMAGKKIVKKGGSLKTEEVEDLEELSTEKLLAYRKKAKAGDIPVRRGVGIDTADEKIMKKTGSYNPSLLQRAKAKLAKEEVEELDELSTDTLKSYRKKARAQGNKIIDNMKVGGGDWSKDQVNTKTLRKRSAGAQMSGKQLVKRGESLKTEEAELEENALNAGDLIKKAKSTLNHDHPAMKHVRALEGIKKYGGAFDVAMDHTKQLKKALGEEAEQIDEAMSSSDRYAATHAEVMRLHKSIGDYLATHKKNAMAHKGEFFNNGQKGPHWGHVADIDNVHSELKGMHDLLARQHEYSNPMRESVEDEVVLTDEEIAALNELNASLEDTVEIEEARGRPPKPGSAAHKRRMEAEKRGETEGDEPRQHIIQQLQRAKLSMQGAAKIKFKNGEEHEVRGAHAAKLLDKYAGMKPSEKESFQKEIGASHEGLKKHL